MGEDKEKIRGFIMKWSTLGFTFLTVMLLTLPSVSATYLGLTFFEHDVLGCQNDSDSPRCKKVKLVACKSICYGHLDENTEFGNACRDMCQLPLKEAEPKAKENEPLTRYQ
jgi:hypothetical protein